MFIVCALYLGHAVEVCVCVMQQSVSYPLLVHDPRAGPAHQEFELLIQHADGLDLFYGTGCTTASHVRSYIQDSAPHPKVVNTTRLLPPKSTQIENK